MHRRAAGGLRFFSGVVMACAFVLGIGSACGDKKSSCPPPDGGATYSGTCGSYDCPLVAHGDPIDGDDYASFAQGVFTSYCIRCHSVTRTDDCMSDTNPLCRNGAPFDHNWDDPASIRQFLDQIRIVIGIQPYFMPPSDPSPTCEERFRMVRWIDAGAPGLP